MQTLKELKKYLDDECYSKVSIGKESKEYADDKFIVWQENARYFFAYCERGNLSGVKVFDTEKEAVAYTLDAVEKDLWAKAHLAAWTWSVKDILDAEQELKRMNIFFKRNDDLHFDEEHGTAYRIFVFGKDILKLSDFSKKYSKRLETAEETKRKLLSEIRKLSEKIKEFPISVHEKTAASPAAGYCLDNKSKVWNVFETVKGNEPSESFESKNGLRAFNERYKIVLEKYKMQQKNQ